jgi:acylphosphatase
MWLRDWYSRGARLKLCAMTEPVTSVRLRIEGRVQGVWYRGWAMAQAQELGLSGWVRNRQDGSVEALVSGPESRLRAMIERCRRGPPAARVDRVLEEPADEPARPGFRQLPTI